MAQPPSEIFKLLSRELRHLAGLTSTLQDQLSHPGYPNSDIEAFQSLDLLNQSLDCLATYVAHLGAASPCQCALSVEDAASVVCLASLAARLRGAPRAGAKLDAVDIELF